MLPSKGSFTATALPGCMSSHHATVLSAMRQPILADEAELLSRSPDQRVAWHLPRRNGVSRQGNRGGDRVQRGSVGQCHGGSAQGGLRSVRILAHLHGAKVAGHLLRRADSPQGIHRGGPTGPRGAGPCPGRKETRVRRANWRSCGRRNSGRDLWQLGLAASERDRTRISRPTPNGVATPYPRRSLVKSCGATIDSKSQSPSCSTRSNAFLITHDPQPGPVGLPGPRSSWDRGHRCPRTVLVASLSRACRGLEARAPRREARDSAKPRGRTEDRA